MLEYKYVYLLAGGDRLNGRESDEAMETDGQFEDAEYDSDH